MQVYEPKPAEPVTPIEPEADVEEEEGEGKTATMVPANMSSRTMWVCMSSPSRCSISARTGSLSPSRSPITPARILITQYPTIETFLTAWFNAERKDAIVAGLLEHGVFLDKMQEEVGLDLDPFDLICHVAFDCKALTRSERANRVRTKPGYFEKYGEAARKVLDALVAKFADDGYATLDKVLDDGQLVNFLSAPPFDQFGRPLEVVSAFGGKEQFHRAMRELQEVIYPRLMSLRGRHLHQHASAGVARSNLPFDGQVSAKGVFRFVGDCFVAKSKSAPRNDIKQHHVAASAGCEAVSCLLLFMGERIASSQPRKSIGAGDKSPPRNDIM